MAFYKIRPKSGTTQQWATANTILGEREIGYEVPSGGVGSGAVRMKMGDGVTPWNDLPYAIDIGLNESDLVQDAVTNDTTRPVSAKVAKDLQTQIDDHEDALAGNIIQAGETTLTPTEADKTCSVAVNFPVAFKEKPSVVVNGQTAYPGGTVKAMAVDNITTTGCTIYMLRSNTTATKVNWIAVGKR